MGGLVGVISEIEMVGYTKFGGGYNRVNLR
jgi:hypothetical protein